MKKNSHQILDFSKMGIIKLSSGIDIVGNIILEKSTNLFLTVFRPMVFYYDPNIDNHVMRRWVTGSDQSLVMINSINIISVITDIDFSLKELYVMLASHIESAIMLEKSNSLKTQFKSNVIH